MLLSELMQFLNTTEITKIVNFGVVVYKRQFSRQ